MTDASAAADVVGQIEATIADRGGKLLDDHLADLCKSGLSDDSIASMQVRSLTAAELGAVLGYIPRGVQSALALPYPGLDFTRHKLFPPATDNSGHSIRYLQAAGSGVHLYILPAVRVVLTDTSVTLYYTEGEKKGAKASQDGFPCVGLGGLWNWLNAGTADGIDELDNIVHVEREEIIAPDSDVWTRPDLLQPVYAFGRDLEARGARVSVVILPAGENGAKVGLDDFLVARGADAFRALTRIPLRHRAFTKQREWYSTWKASRTPKAEDAGQGQALTLSDPDPWPEPVNGAKLLDGIARVLTRYVVLPAGAAVILALWVVLSYVLDAFGIAPIVGITSPQPECGKSTLLAVLGAMVRRALPAANISPAAVYRTIEVAAPTLLIDEADSFLANNEELRGVLNSGHTRPTAFVIRCVGDDHEPRRFGTFCLKALAAIGDLPATLKSRAISIRLKRRTASEPIETLPMDTIDRNLEPLRRQAIRWASNHLSMLRELRPDIKAINRLADNLRPLFAIADAAGGEWLDRARKAAEEITGTREDDDLGTQLLTDFRELFKAHKTDRIASEAAVNELVKLEHRPWPEMGRQHKPLTKRGLAGLLKPFGIIPKSVRLSPTETPKGYDRADFDDAFRRYLPAGNATTPQPVPALEKVEVLHPPQEGGCGGSENATSPYSDKACGGVADEREVVRL